MACDASPGNAGPSLPSPLPGGGQEPAGIGLRLPHLAELEAAGPPAWLEVHSENLFGLGPALQARLLALRRDCAFSMHGVGLSLGSADGLAPLHLQRLADAVRLYEPELVSEHLCWNAWGGVHVPDLLPLPLTRAMLAVVVANVQRAQDALARPLVIENLSAYLRWADDEMEEGPFLAELAARTGCRVLVDLNNLHVNQLNLGEEPDAFLASLPPAVVAEYHLAGPSEGRGPAAGTWIDTHATPVPEPVWALYDTALQRWGPRPTIVERDQDLPPLPALLDECARAAAAMARTTAAPESRP